MQLAAAVGVAVKLGRVSNLPTIWTNTLVGVTLAGASLSDPRVPLLLVALSLFYIGGMYLNDAYDRDFDAGTRPDRPIPAGQVGAATVFAAGFGMLGGGVALLAIAGLGWSGGTGWPPVAAGAALAAAIVLYNAYHKNNPLSPVLMGLCRMLVYVSAATAIVAVPGANLWTAAVVLLCYLIGLTYTAKREHLNELGSIWPLAALAVPVGFGVMLAMPTPLVWPFLLLFAGCVLYALRLLRRRARGDVPRAVVTLIAGISLLDAVILCAAGAIGLALAAVAAFVLTLALQKLVSGT